MILVIPSQYADRVLMWMNLTGYPVEKAVTGHTRTGIYISSELDATDINAQMWSEIKLCCLPYFHEVWDLEVKNSKRDHVFKEIVHDPT